MTTLIMAIIIYLTINAVMTNNPVNMSIIITAIATLLFFQFSNLTGDTWIPAIYFLLIMGGILITFIILSSVMPNENINKGYFSPIIFTIGVMFSFPSTFHIIVFPVPTAIAALIGYNWNYWMFIGLVITYFLTFVSIIIIDSTSLRIQSCQNNFNFVS